MKTFVIIKHYFTENDCYKRGVKRKSTKGIVRHSTGVNNPNLKRYIDDPERLGVNQYNNHFNRPGLSKCVHFWIGLDKNKEVQIYQTLPLDYRCYGCGSGENGSYNDTHIQYEICEDGLTDATYYKAVMEAAAWLDCYLCKLYNLPASSIVSHKEAHAKGYASNHTDCDHWLEIHGDSMNSIRSDVKALLSGGSDDTHAPSVPSTPSAGSGSDTGSSSGTNSYRIRIACDELNIRSGPSISYKVVGCIRDNNVYTIVEEKDGWGRLKSGAGWISLKYVKKV